MAMDFVRMISLFNAERLELNPKVLMTIGEIIAIDSEYLKKKKIISGEEINRKIKKSLECYVGGALYNASIINRQDVTMKEIAKRVGVTPETVSKYSKEIIQRNKDYFEGMSDIY